MGQVYLDNNATTRLAPEVLEGMRPFQEELFGNASSLHQLGRQARRAVDRAREQVANLIGAEPSEIVFTSGGTESDNAAILAALQHFPKRLEIVTTAVEHPAVLDCVAYCHERGYRVKRLGVGKDGQIDMAAFDRSLSQEVAVASVMMANNETGVIFPVRELAAMAKEKGLLFHSDAVQALGKMSLNVRDLGADYLSFSAHKLHGPKGVGALFIRQGAPFSPLLYGGQQESSRRSGTENVPGIVGFGIACALAKKNREQEFARIKELRDRLEENILSFCKKAIVNAREQERLPNTSNISFVDLEGESLLLHLDEEGVCVSTGSACASGLREPSRVLGAMGVPAAQARGAIRFSLSRFTSEAEIDQALVAVKKALRALS